MTDDARLVTISDAGTTLELVLCARCVQLARQDPLTIVEDVDGD